MAGSSDLLCCLPRVEAPAALGYENVFRVLIVQFMGSHSLDIRTLKKSCIRIAQPDGRLIPFESFKLFHRDRRGALLATIRDELSTSFRHRSGAAAVRFMPAVSTASQRSGSGHEAATSAGSMIPAGPRNT